MSTTPDDHGASAGADDALEEPQRERLSPQWIRVERIRGAGVVAVLVAVSLVILASLAVGFWPPQTWWWAVLAGWGLMVIALSAFAYLWPSLEYRYASFSADARGLEIRRGVLWRIVTSIPRGRVQHTDVTQGPLERSLDVARLIIHTAGTQHATVELEGLDHARAVRLRDFLIAEGNADADAE